MKNRGYRRISILLIAAMLFANTGATAYAADETHIVDGVQIHTPVMAPGTIYSDDQLPANQEERHEIIPTNLVKDNSQTDTANLRLDQFYYIKWKDLSELINRYSASDKQHRDGDNHYAGDGGIAATPTLGGYDTETDDKGTEYLEEDQFTLNKYMKFPFEVFYNGFFYKANQWIKIEAPEDIKREEAEKPKVDGDGHLVEPLTPGTDLNVNYYGYMRKANLTVKDNGSITSDNHWICTPFYIPTWAKEGLYEDIEFPASETDNTRFNPSTDLGTCVQLRVEAINSEGETGNGLSRAEELEQLANVYYNIDMDNVGAGKYDDGAAYAAIFNLPAQLSGWIYGFTITGTSEYDTFATQKASDLTSQKVGMVPDYSFTVNKQDKRAGTLNRLGMAAIRYLKDGLIAKGKNEEGKLVSQWDPVNTIALDGAWKDISGKTHYGKSNAYKYMGTVPKGTSFSYTLKTMSNMWNFNGKDEIRITPTFTYRKYDKTKKKWINIPHKDLKVYYSEDDVSYIPYGSKTDRSLVQSANLGNKQFEQSYYTQEDSYAIGNNKLRYGDWVTYTAFNHDLRYGLLTNPKLKTYTDFKKDVENEGLIGLNYAPNALTPQMWLTLKHKIYCLSKIVIPEGMRLLSGEPDQLKINNYKEGYDVTDKKDAASGKSGFMTYGGMSDEFGSDLEYTGKFEDGKHEEGSESTKIKINVIDKVKGNIEKEVEISDEDKFRYSIQSWYGKYYVPQDLYVVDLKEHPEFRDFSDKDSPYHDKVEADGSVKIDGQKYWDYLEYYAVDDYEKKDGLKQDEDIFLQDGYLCINFNIIAVKQGNDYLQYKGNNAGNKGAWGTENYQIVPDDPSEIAPPEPGTTEDGVPTTTGDTVVVDLKKSFTDRYRMGLYNLN